VSQLVDRSELLGLIRALNYIGHSTSVQDPRGISTPVIAGAVQLTGSPTN
jgi:hypothetical protein